MVTVTLTRLIYSFRHGRHGILYKWGVDFDFSRVALRWFSSYLENRSPVIQVSHYMSTTHDLHYCVPQTVRFSFLCIPFRQERSLAHKKSGTCSMLMKPTMFPLTHKTYHCFKTFLLSQPVDFCRSQYSQSASNNSCWSPSLYKTSNK